MLKLIAFGLLSVPLVWISRASLRAPRSHGFYRFFAWEFILALFLLNVDSWFRDPFSWHQVIAWLLLTLSLPPLALGVRALSKKGKPGKDRAPEESLLGFEKTTALVTTGIYRYIRHPLYGSLLLLTWGIFFKDPAWPAALLALAASAFLFGTARADEAECIRYFGAPYRDYMRRSRMFIPFVF
jgi:protein-S-isoprenylcysteine O-methyltransferase Ste14